MSSQEAFLSRVRRALQVDSEAVVEPASPDSIDPASIDPASIETMRARLREQRPALVARLQEELKAVGGKVVRVQSVAEATQYVTQLAEELDAGLVVRWESEVLEALEIDAALAQGKVESHIATAPRVESESASEIEAKRQALRELLARADIGLSGVDFAIAETGTVALSALPGQMRGVSLLPPVHVAVARSEQIVATMADCLALLQAEDPDVQRRLTSCVAFITGPSRTGDIELSLTIGVHGPGELHLVIVDEASGPE